MRHRHALPLLALLATGLGAPDVLHAATAWTLTPNGYGPVRIGMTSGQAAKALGAALEVDMPTSNDDPEDFWQCHLAGPSVGDRDITFMLEKGRITRISVYGRSKVRTPRGVGVGAPESEVRRAYPVGLVVIDHFYADPPAKYLTFWTRPARKGVRFETDENRRVSVIHAGRASIEYVEDCL